MTNCPHCETEIDEHEANRCLRGWVAKDVMGWRVENGKDGLPAHAFPSETEHVYLLPDLGPQWYPDHDIAAAWEVVERVGQDNSTHLIWYNAEGRSPYFVAAFGFGKKVEAKADAMPLAICRAALKATVKEFA